MNSVNILISKNNKFNKQVNKIVNQASYNINVLYIEDVITIDKNSITYVLIPNYFDINDELLENYNVINKKYFINKYSKKDVQIILNNNNILTPEILNDIDNFPVYLKENKHEGIVEKILNYQNFCEKTINLNDYYIEKCINIENEIKLYYIFGKLYNYKEEIKDINLLDICNNISNVLSLDIMSIDLIFHEGKYYVIDVNHSPGFYLSDVARLELIKRLVL